MISVIILSQNLKYAVLDVPSNGKLTIREKHLICGIVQNGVKCLPYGNILSSFETFLQNETLSVSIIPHSEFMPEGRILDFTIIELLQVSTTIPLSASGSNVAFVPPVYDAGGSPVNYSMRIKGANFSSAGEATNWLNGSLTGNLTHPDAFVNSLGNDGVYQLLSCVGIINTLPIDLFNRPEYPITEFYDFGGNYRTFKASYALMSPTMQILELGGLELFINTTITGNGIPNLKTLKLPAVTLIGTNQLWNSTFNTYPVAVNIFVPRSFETSNAGALEGDLENYQSARQGIISFID